MMMLAKLRSSVTNAPPRSWPATTLLKSTTGPVLRDRARRARRHARLHVLEAGHRHRRLVDRIQLARAGHVHFEAERRLGADVLDLIERAIRHLHHDALGGDDRLAPFDREAQRARLHDPPLTRVAVHPPRRLAARAPSRSTARTGSRRPRSSRPSRPGRGAGPARPRSFVCGWCTPVHPADFALGDMTISGAFCAPAACRGAGRRLTLEGVLAAAITTVSAMLQRQPWP